MLLKFFTKLFQIFLPKNHPKPRYTIFDRGNDLHFRIDEGHYRGTTVKYYNVQILEDEGFAKLKFGYDVVRTDFLPEEELQNDSKFVTIIGDILQHYILNEAKQVETTRSSNSKEFGL